MVCYAVNFKNSLVKQDSQFTIYYFNFYFF